MSKLLEHGAEWGYFSPYTKALYMPPFYSREEALEDARGNNELEKLIEVGTFDRFLVKSFQIKDSASWGGMDWRRNGLLYEPLRVVEAGAVISLQDDVLLWHSPKDALVGALPDSADLWSYLWARRVDVRGVAHTHPWAGEARASSTDLSTFAAIEAGLGRRLDWWVVTFTEVRHLRWDRDGYKSQLVDPPKWATPLRVRSLR